SYVYDGDGRRMGKTVSGTPESYVWDQAEGLPLILQDGRTDYVTGLGGLPLEQVSGTTVNYYHQDQLGSTRAISNALGVAVASYTYDVYGNLTSPAPLTTNPFRYAGQYLDSESGMYYL